MTRIPLKSKGKIKRRFMSNSRNLTTIVVDDGMSSQDKFMYKEWLVNPFFFHQSSTTKPQYNRQELTYISFEFCVRFQGDFPSKDKSPTTRSTLGDTWRGALGLLVPAFFSRILMAYFLERENVEKWLSALVPRTLLAMSFAGFLLNPL